MNPTPVYIEGLNAPRRDGARAVPALMTVLVFLVLGFGAYYVYNTAQDRALENRANKEAAAILANEAEMRLAVEKAIQSNVVIAGMTKRETILSRGEPGEILRGPQIPDVVRNGGGVELWQYGQYWVVFNMDGLVLYSRDMLKTQP